MATDGPISNDVITDYRERRVLMHLQAPDHAVKEEASRAWPTDPILIEFKAGSKHVKGVRLVIESRQQSELTDKPSGAAPSQVFEMRITSGDAFTEHFPEIVIGLTDMQRRAILNALDGRDRY